MDKIVEAFHDEKREELIDIINYLTGVNEDLSSFSNTQLIQIIKLLVQIKP